MYSLSLKVVELKIASAIFLTLCYGTPAASGLTQGRFYRHWLIEKGFPHHGAVAFGHFGKALYEVFKYIGVDVSEIGYNQPVGVRYPTENPWG